MRRRPALVFAFAAATVSVTACALHAQQQDDPPPPPNLYTLHVYANLMQFPTIVLGPDLKPIPPVPREKFAITLDSGPVFHPTKMRIEGDDPISFSVLLDAAGDQSKVLDTFTQAFAQIAPGAFHSQDVVSIYAVDCKVMRTLKDAPAMDSEAITKGIANALDAPGLHGKKAKSGCRYSLHLWDALRIVGEDMGDSPSRRVLLVVSSGRESGSKSSFSAASLDLGSRGIAVFGLRDNMEFQRLVQYGSPMNSGRGIGIAGVWDVEDLFSLICARNGGMVLDAVTPGVAKDLQHLVDLLRGRYILEYPRPEDITASVHALVITIPGTDNFIRPTGGSSPIPDPAIAADPSTLPSTPSPAKIGKRRHLDPKS